MEASVQMDFIQFAASYIIVLIVFALAAWYGLMRGIGVVSAATLALPLTLLVYEAGLSSAYLSSLFVDGLQNPPVGLAIFAVIFLGIYVAVRQVSANTHSGAFGIIRALMASMACTGMFLAVWHAFSPLSTIWYFGAEFDRIFPAHYFFWWIIAMLLLTYASGFSLPRRQQTTTKPSKSDAYASGITYN